MIETTKNLEQIIKEAEFLRFEILNALDLNRDFIEYMRSHLKKSILITNCDHEPDLNIGNDPRPRYEKSKYPLCIKCRKIYHE